MVFLSLTACAGGNDVVAPTPTPPLAATNSPPLKPGTLINPGEVTMPTAPDTKLAPDQCTQVPTNAPVNNGCETAVLHCGESITGHTLGGVSKFDTRFYEKNFCTPATTDHNGGEERIYILDLPEPQTRAIVYLDTPCGNLDLAAFKVTGSQACPNADSPVGQCEMNVKPGITREKVDLWNNGPTRWWIVVEGERAEEGAFALTVQCEKW